jgi:hypothetical protein
MRKKGNPTQQTIIPTKLNVAKDLADDGDYEATIFEDMDLSEQHITNTHLFPYSVQWKFTSRTIYAADQRIAQTFGYHLLKSVCRSDPVVRHLISVTRLDPAP